MLEWDVITVIQTCRFRRHSPNLRHMVVDLAVGSEFQAEEMMSIIETSKVEKYTLGFVVPEMALERLRNDGLSRVGILDLVVHGTIGTEGNPVARQQAIIPSIDQTYFIVCCTVRST